jgi:hypothetical protein
MLLKVDGMNVEDDDGDNADDAEVVPLILLHQFQ